jgi:hypothetical protein
MHFSVSFRMAHGFYRGSYGGIWGVFFYRCWSLFFLLSRIFSTFSGGSIGIAYYFSWKKYVSVISAAPKVAHCLAVT